mmetsp:Transcript_27930/g.67867  ORF Transcript_27930/g.67867 Transcript_27930/m.67867 type:complete len:3798 (+) Transcript_27930:39-11432(+)
MRIDRAKLPKPEDAHEEEAGIIQLRGRLAGKEVKEVVDCLREVHHWQWGKADFAQWAEILDVFDAHLKQAVNGNTDPAHTVAVLRFTLKLINNCTDPAPYNSHDRLLGLLTHEHPTIVMWVLLLFHGMFKHTGCRSNELLDRQIFKDRIFSLAIGFCVPDSTQSLRQISSKLLTQTEAEEIAKKLKFAFPPNNSSKECVVSLAQVVLGRQKKTKLDFNGVVKKYHVPERYRFSLRHHLNFTREFYDGHLRQTYVRIKLIAIRLAMCFSWSKKEFLSKHFKSNPHLTEMILDLIQNTNLVPLGVTLIAIDTLKSLSQVPYVDTRMRDLHVLSDGIIPSLLHQCITRLKTNPNEPSDLLLTECLLSFIQKICSETMLTLPRDFRPSDVMDWMMNLVSNLSVTGAAVLLRALRIIEKLISPNRLMGNHTAARNRFHNASGFDVCLKRLEQMFACPEEKRVPLTGVRIVRSDMERKNRMEIMNADHILGKCVKAFLRVASISVRHHRQQHVRSDYLKEGRFADITITLWKVLETSYLTSEETDKKTKEAYGKERISANKVPTISTRSSKRRKTRSSQKPSTDVKMATANKLPRSPSFKELLGDKIFALSCALLCNVIQNRPACLKSLHESGITRAFLEALKPERLRTEAVIKTAPETIRSLCMNPDGLKAILDKNPLRLLFDLISSPTRQHLKILNAQTVFFLGRSFEELFRHYPPFVGPGIKCCKRVLVDIAGNRDLGNETLIDCLANASQLLATLMRQFGKKIVELGEESMITQAVTDLYERQTKEMSLTDICGQLASPMITLANQEPEKVTRHLLDSAVDLVGQVMESKSFKEQSFLSWRNEEKLLVKEVQDISHMNWYMSVLLKLSRRALSAMVKHEPFKKFVEMACNVVCLCKWNVTCALLQNPELAAKTKNMDPFEKRNRDDIKVADEQKDAEQTPDTDRQMETEQPSSSKAAKAKPKNSDSKEIDPKLIEKFRLYRNCSKSIFLMAGKLMRFLARSSRSGSGDFLELVHQIMMTYLEFRPRNLEDWTPWFSFSKGTMKLCSSMLLGGASDRASYGFNNRVFKQFTQNGGASKIVEIFKWLLEIPRHRQASYFETNPWKFEAKAPLTSKTMCAAQALLMEIGSLIYSLASHVPKSSICLELIEHGLKPQSPLYCPQFCQSVILTTHCVLTKTDETKKKEHNEENLNKLLNMGFGRARSLRALKMHRHQFVRAMEWLLAHPEDSASAEVVSDDGSFQKALSTIDSVGFIKSLFSCVRQLCKSKQQYDLHTFDLMVVSCAGLLRAMCELDDREVKEPDIKKVDEGSVKDEKVTEKAVEKEPAAVWRRAMIIDEILKLTTEDTSSLKSPTQKVIKSPVKASRRRSFGTPRSKAKGRLSQIPSMDELHTFAYLLGILVHEDPKCREASVRRGFFQLLLSRGKRIVEWMKNRDKIWLAPKSIAPSPGKLLTPGKKRKHAASPSRRKKIAKSREGKRVIQGASSSQTPNSQSIWNKPNTVQPIDFSESCLCIFLCIFNNLLDASESNVWNDRVEASSHSVADRSGNPVDKALGKGGAKPELKKGDSISGKGSTETDSLLNPSDVDSLLSFCIPLLKLPMVDALPPLLELLSKLTKSHRNAVYFAKKSGVISLFKLKSMPELKRSIVIVCQILRHVVEHPAALQHGMEKEIFCFLSDASNAPKGKANLERLIISLSPVVRRDPTIFQRALTSICKFELQEPGFVSVSTKEEKLKRRFQFEERDQNFITRFMNSLLQTVMMDHGLIEGARETKDKDKKSASRSESGREAGDNRSAEKSTENGTNIKDDKRFDRGLGYKPLLQSKRIMSFFRHLIDVYDQYSDIIVSFELQAKGNQGKEERKISRSFVSDVVTTVALDAKPADARSKPVSDAGMLLLSLCSKSRKSGAPRIISEIFRKLEEAESKPESVHALLLVLKFMLYKREKRIYMKHMVDRALMELLTNLLEWMKGLDDFGSSMLRTFYKILVTTIKEDEAKPLGCPEDKALLEAEEEWFDPKNRDLNEPEPSRPNADPLTTLMSGGSISSNDLLEAIRRRAGGQRRGAVQVVLHNPMGQFRFNLFQPHGEEDLEDGLEDGEFSHNDHVFLIDRPEDAAEEEGGILAENNDVFPDQDEDEGVPEDEDEDEHDEEDVDDEMSEVRMEDDEDIESEGVEMDGQVFAEELQPGERLEAIEIVAEADIDDDEDIDEDEDLDEDVNEEEVKQMLEAEEESKMEDGDADDEDLDEDENDDIIFGEDDIDAVIREEEDSARDTEFLPAADIQPLQYNDEAKTSKTPKMPEYFQGLFGDKYNRHVRSHESGNTTLRRWHEFGHDELPRSEMKKLQSIIRATVIEDKPQKKEEANKDLSEKPANSSNSEQSASQERENAEKTNAVVSESTATEATAEEKKAESLGQNAVPMAEEKDPESSEQNVATAVTEAKAAPRAAESSSSSAPIAAVTAPVSSPRTSQASVVAPAAANSAADAREPEASSFSTTTSVAPASNSTPSSTIPVTSENAIDEEPQIDLSFLAGLPPDIQAEVLSTQSQRLRASRQRAATRGNATENKSGAPLSTVAVSSPTQSNNQSNSTGAQVESKSATSFPNSVPEQTPEAGENKSSDVKQSTPQSSNPTSTVDASSSSGSGPNTAGTGPASNTSSNSGPGNNATRVEEGGANSESNAPSSSSNHDGPDPAFLAALPEEMRREVIAQHAVMRRMETSLSQADQRAAQEMDQASVLATLPPNLRREWLLQQPESSLVALPPPVLAEAMLMRHRRGADYIFGGFRAGGPRRSSRITDAPVSSSHRNTKGKAPKLNLKMWVGRETDPIVTHKLTFALVNRLCIFKFAEVSAYNRVLSALCGNKVSRQLLLHVFMLILNFGSVKKASSRDSMKQVEILHEIGPEKYWSCLKAFANKLPTRMIGDDAASFWLANSFPPPLLVARILQVMAHLVLHRPQMMLHFFFKSSSDDFKVIFKGGDTLHTRNGTWLEQLFALYSASPFSWSAKHMEFLTQFLLEILLRREKQRKEFVQPENVETEAKKEAKEVKEEKIPKDRTGRNDETKNDMEVEAESSSSSSKPKPKGNQAADNVHDCGEQPIPEFVKLDMPVVNPEYLTPFIRAFLRTNCAEKIFNMAMKIAKYLAEKDENKDSLLREIGQTTKTLSGEIDDDLKKCISSIPTGKTISDDPMTKFGGSLYKLSGKQSRLLRLLSFLDSMKLLEVDQGYSKSEDVKGTSKITILEISELIPCMETLWDTLDSYLLKLVPPKASDSKTAPQRSGKQGKKRDRDGNSVGSPRHATEALPKPKSPKTPRSSGRRSRRLPSDSKARRLSSGPNTATSSSATPADGKGNAIDLEEDDSDVSHIMQLLPLIESYFVVNAPKTEKDIESPQFSKFLKFTHTHSKILNVFCQKKPGLMQRTMKSLLWHPKKILNFHNKHTHFLGEIRKQRGATGALGSMRIFCRRDRLFEDSYHQFQLRSADELKSPITVRFHGEEGVDAGGLTREWFLMLSRAIFNPGYALFQAAADNSNVFQPNKASDVNPDHLMFFRFVGRFVGKAIYDQQLLDAYFTRSFYKHMLGVKPTISDVESVDPDYYKSLRWMMNNSIENVLELTFVREGEEFGKKKVTELKAGGKDIPVTDENKLEYVSLMAERMLTDDIKPQIDAFLKGFREMIDPQLLSIFNEQEIELLICGLPKIDIHDLKANTEYKGLTSSSENIRWFWQIVEDLTQEEKALLVQFVTGTSKVPIQGFKELQGVNGVQRFQIHKASGSDRLPTAHTCFNQLDLPSYSSLKSMRKNLLLAIREGSEGFAFR